MGQYMTRCADRRIDKTTADGAAGAQCARSSSSAHFFKAAGKSICVGEEGRGFRQGRSYSATFPHSIGAAGGPGSKDT